MAFNYVGVAFKEEETSDTTLSTTDALNVATGDLLVAWTKWEAVVTTLSTVKDQDTNNSFAIGTRANSANNVLGCMAWKIAATAKTGALFTATWAAACEYKSLFVMQFTPDASETVTQDGENVGIGAGSSACLSGNITTSDDALDAVLCGGSGYYSYLATTAEQIGDVNATGTTDGVWGGMWYRIVTEKLTNAHAQCVSGAPTNTTWVCNIVAFKSVAAAGGTTIPRYKKFYDYRRQL